MTLSWGAGTTGEHYARTDTGELIGPYETAAECERERVAANNEQSICQPGTCLGVWRDDA